MADVSTSAALLRAFLMDSIPPAAAVCYFATHRHNITVNDTVPDTILVDMATFNGERVTVPETIFVDMAMSSVPFSAYRFSDLGAYHITRFIRTTQILIIYCSILKI